MNMAIFIIIIILATSNWKTKCCQLLLKRKPAQDYPKDQALSARLATVNKEMRWRGKPSPLIFWQEPRSAVKLHFSREEAGRAKGKHSDPFSWQALGWSRCAALLGSFWVAKWCSLEPSCQLLCTPKELKLWISFSSESLHMHRGQSVHKIA